MDDVNEDDPNTGRCERVHVSKSGGLLTGSKPLELDNAVEKQETGKCGHFSIRRYVAETRKKDWKSCWPFWKSEDHHKLEQDPKLLPPLSVPEFRWWDCQNCLKKNGTDRAGEVSTNYLGDQRPNIALVDGEALLPSDNSTKLLHGVDQSPSGKSTCKEGDVAENLLKSSALEEDVTSIHPFIGDPSDKMVQYASPDRDNQVPENNVDQVNYGKICDVIDAEPCKRGQSVTEETGEVTITFDLNKPACNLSLSEPTSTSDPVSCEPVVSETAVTKSLGNGECSQEVLPNQKISVMRPHLASPASLDKGIAEPNYKNNLAVGVEITMENHGSLQLADVVTGETGEDICHNAAAIPVNELAFLGLAESDDEFPPDIYNLDSSESPCGSSNGIWQQKRIKKMRLLTDILKSEHLVFSNENNRNPSKGKGNKQKKEFGVENSDSSLMCRPEDMLEKLQGQVIGDESNKPEIDAESKTEEKGKDYIFSENDNDGMAREERQHLTLGEDDFSREGAAKNNDTAQSKNIMSKKTKKLPRIDDLNSLPQDSPGIGKCRSIQDFQLPQEVSGHKRTAQANSRHQEASLDDIPMDIVELLAKNQHERCLQNAEAAKVGKVDKLVTTQNMSFNIIDFIGKSMENYEKKLDSPYHTSGNLNDIGFKQRERCTQGFVPWSQSKQKTTGIQFRSPDLSRDHERMSLTCSQWLEQCHKNQMGLPKSSFGQPKHGASVPLHAIPHDYSSTKASSSTNVDGTSLKSTNLDFCLQPQKKKVKFQAQMNREHFAPYLYPNATKGRNTGVQMEIPTSDTIPAMHLLRLMNQGAHSSTPTPLRMHGSQGNFLQKNHFGHSQARKFFDLQSGGVTEINRASLHHRSFQSIHQKQQQGNPFEILPPVARVSSVGPLLPDIPTHSNSYRLPVGFTSGFHTEMQASSSQGHRKKKARNTQSLAQSTNLKPNNFVPSVNISSHTETLHPRAVMIGHTIEQNNKKALALPVESSNNSEPCSVNRNPAEFSIPEEGNIYMIGSDDLKCRNLSPLKDPDARKRQRILKLTAIQGY
ncbi:protein EMBRYONIC FLOWER 1-like [Aristolochia californica]|uniref:protein EMBRYONIC FLOWER 1-like n=1 Tax=Aristolochia californica TaxID=171875 RepID=UPI0035D84848